MSKENNKEKSSLPEKMRQFFKLGKESKSQGSSVGEAGREAKRSNGYALTAQTIKDLSVSSPTNIRLKTLKELSEVVSGHRLEEHAIEKLWMETNDLLVPSQPMEVRHQAFNFFNCLVKGQLEYMRILRSHFFNVVESHKMTDDATVRLELLKSLSEGGKNIVCFEEEIGPFLLRWMPELFGLGKSNQLLPLVTNVIKYNAAYLDEDIVTGFIMHSGQLCRRRTSNEQDIKNCLDLLDAIVCYSYLPNEALVYFVETLCHVVNVDRFSDDALKVTRKFLGTNFGHGGIYAMCNILQDRHSYDFRLMRGAVFFVGMCLWGSQKVTSLKHTPAAVLPSFLHAMKSNNPVVIKEIVQSIDRLVRKYGSDLDLLTWELIFDIMEFAIKYVHENLSATDIENSLHQIVSVVEELMESHRYSGSIERLFRSVDEISENRPESSVLKLIEYESRSFYPTQDGWIDNIVRLMERYYQRELRKMIRIKALDVLSSILCATRYIYEDELMDRIVLVYFTDLDLDADRSVRTVAVQLLVDLAILCNTNRCLDLLKIIRKVVDKPFEGIRGDVCCISDDRLTDVATAIKGLIDIFKHKIHTKPSSFAIFAHECLVRHINRHYDRYSCFERANSFRYCVIEHLLQIRASSLGQIGVMKNDERSMKTLEYSSYLFCGESPNNLLSSLSPDSQRSLASFPSSPPTCLPMNSAFHVIVSCLVKERDWKVLEMTLVELPKILQNKTLLLSTRGIVETICRSLCDMVGKTTSKLFENLTNCPPKFSDFHRSIFPALAALTSYNRYLSPKIQSCLVKCLQFGLVSRQPSMCIEALTDCTLEMQEVVYKMLPDILLSLSKISATVGIASAILEFLSTLIMLPSLYSSFVEDQYMSIFAISLPYTNPVKFDHYIVSLAHHVIATWFLKCRLPYRRNFVKFITKGLNANIVGPCEDNSEARRRSSSLNEAPKEQPPTNQQLSNKRQSLHPGSSAAASAVEITKKERGGSEDGSEFSVAMKFHLELTEVCSDFLARYAFSAISNMTVRSPLSEFLLKGGQTSSWLVGTSVVTVTTSGCGSKVLRQGLCQKCYHMCRKDDDSSSSITDSSEEVLPAVKPSPAVTLNARRRHQSAAVAGLPRLINTNLSVTKDDFDVKRSEYRKSTSVDSPGVSQSRIIEGSVPGCGSAGGDLTSSVQEVETKNISKLLFGNEEQGSSLDTDICSSRRKNLCSCWCQGWAEVQIRKPTGNTSWMMRIQNICQQPSSSSNSFADFPLADLASLFLPSKTEQSDDGLVEDYHVTRTHKRIDSESLAENEYEAIYKEHFSAATTTSTAGLDKETPTTPQPFTSPVSNQPTVSNESNLEDCTKNSPPASPQTSPSKVRKSTKTVEQGSKLRPSNRLNLGRKANSPPASPQINKDDESLRPMPRSRVHTVSVMTRSADSTSSQFARSANSLKREIYKTGIDPSFVFLQLYHNSYFGSKKERPVLIPNHQSMKTALKLLDLIPTYMNHKIGVVYVDKGQVAEERKFLTNEFGSVRYVSFLSGLGCLIKLETIDKNFTYMGGMDAADDGQFTYLWQDDIMQVVFHVATLMPTTKDPSQSNKKRHIGNDYVVIVYNDSGEEFKIDTIKGQFCYACVVIEPVDFQSNLVTIKVKEELEKVIGRRPPKVVSDNNLAIVVRQLALHADLASTIHKTRISFAQDPFESNWLRRLRQIKRLRPKIAKFNQENGHDEPVAHDKQDQHCFDFTDYV